MNWTRQHVGFMLPDHHHPSSSPSPLLSTLSNVLWPSQLVIVMRRVCWGCWWWCCRRKEGMVGVGIQAFLWSLSLPWVGPDVGICQGAQWRQWVAAQWWWWCKERMFTLVCWRLDVGVWNDFAHFRALCRLIVRILRHYVSIKGWFTHFSMDFHEKNCRICRGCSRWELYKKCILK